MSEFPSAEFPAAWAQYRTVLAHDWLTGMRGGENVLELLARGFPQAPILTLVHNRPAVSPAINAHPVRTSPLQRLPGIYANYRHYLPLFPLAMRALSPPSCDLVISSSHCVAKAVRPPPGAVHLCYCFTPMRYAWLFYDEYFGTNPIKAALLKPVLAALRRWDRSVSTRVTRFIGISRHVQERISRFYGRESDLVYPPVDTDYYTPGSDLRGPFDLIVSALVPYKRVDLAVETYTAKGWPLKVVGVGGDLTRLRSIAGPTVEFLEWQPRETIRELYRSCRFLVFPGEEDFGIVPVEAQSCGTPVIAFARGGALETVEAGCSGEFFAEQSTASLADAVAAADARSWDRGAIRTHAERFSVQAFIDGMNRVIADQVQR